MTVSSLVLVARRVAGLTCTVHAAATRRQGSLPNLHSGWVTRSGADQQDDPTGPALTAVGPRLRALRHWRGETLAQVCDATGVSVRIMSRLESG